MSNNLLFKQIRLCVVQLCLVIGWFWLGSHLLYAQTPTLNIEVNGDHYPEIGIAARCRGVGAGANELFLEVYEDNQRQQRSPVTVKAAAPKRILFFLDISVYSKAALQQIADALYTFNDLCTWGKDDQIAVYIPTVRDHNYDVVPLVHWTPDRIGAANRIRQFADAVDNPQTFAASDPELCNLATQLPYAYTPLYDLTVRANDIVLSNFSPPATRGILVVFSDGVHPGRKAAEFAVLGKQIREMYDLFTVFLADVASKQPQNLLALVDTQANPTHYFALGSSASLTLAELWRQLENPQTYKFTYDTQSPPPVVLTVEVRADERMPVRVRNSLYVQLQPVQLTIIDPPLGTVFPVTRTAETDAAVDLTQTITVHAKLGWPPQRAPKSAQLFYRVDNQMEQSRTLTTGLTSTQIISFPLGALTTGMHQVAVRVEGDHPTLHATDALFFEIRETVFHLIARNEAELNQVNQQVSWQWVVFTLGALVTGGMLWLLLTLGLGRNRRQAEERDEQLEKQLTRLQLEQKSLAGSIVPMTASNWKLEQPKLKAALFLIQGGGVPEFIPILADEEYSVTTLGSGDRNTVRLWHRYIDDQHCLIRYENNKFFIRDGWQDEERSTNGTYVNHESVGPTERKLENGDLVQLGLSVRYSFRTKQPDHALPAEAAALDIAPTPATMMLALADPPTAATPPAQTRQSS